jgi:hypothetical protein
MFPLAEFPLAEAAPFLRRLLSSLLRRLLTKCRNAIIWASAHLTILALGAVTTAIEVCFRPVSHPIATGNMETTTLLVTVARKTIVALFAFFPKIAQFAVSATVYVSLVAVQNPVGARSQFETVVVTSIGIAIARETVCIILAQLPIAARVAIAATIYVRLGSIFNPVGTADAEPATPAVAVV